MQHTLILPSGREISSGASGTAICSLRSTRRVNREEYLAPGSVAAAQLEIELFDPENLAFSQGDPITVKNLGTFYIDTATRRGKRLTLTAYDCLTRLDEDLTAWLEGLEAWPYSLSDFAAMVCARCGITLESRDIPNGDHLIPQFRGVNITGRQLLQWAGQACCRYLIATGPSSAAFSWYEDRGTAIGLTGEAFCYRDSLTLEEPQTPPKGLWLRRNEQDLGILAGEAENALCITGNYLLTEATEATAGAILAQLQLSYHPGSFETPAQVEPGEILHVDGKAFLAMEVVRTGSRCTVRCFAAPAAQSRMQSRYQALAGRTMELQLELEGMKAQVSQVQGMAENAAALSLTVDGLRSEVTAAREEGAALLRQSTVLTQRADSLEFKVLETASMLDAKADGAAVQELAVHFRIDADGLTLRDTATGMGVQVNQNRVAFTGGANPTTVITPQAMTTTDLSVENRLVLGHFTLLPRTNGNLSLRYIGN